MIRSRSIFLTAIAATAALALSACSAPQDSASSGAPTEMTTVSYLTGFNTFGRESYVYVADKLGYFEEVGIEVVITPGTGSVDVLKLVAGGQADVGIADLSAVAITLGAGELPVHVVAAVHQSSLAGLMTTESTGISGPDDLPGRTVGDQPGSVNQLLFPVYAEAAGIDPGSVTFVASTPPSLPQLLASKSVDAIGQLAVGEPLIQSAIGDDTALFLSYSELLPELYGNAVIASDAFVDADPELAAKFVGALFKGLAYSLENPEEAAAILLEYQPTQNAEVAATELTIMADYVGDNIGELTEERLQSTIDILVSAGAITDGSVTIESLANLTLLGGAK